MKLFALALVALAVVAIMPASAQSGVVVKNSLVVVSAQDDIVVQSITANGGSPASILKTLEATRELVPISALAESTDSSGQFVLEAPIEAGSYSATAFAPGFVASANSFTIDATGQKNITIFMQPSAMVSGRVTDEQGRTIPGIVVAVSNPHSVNYDITMDDGLFVLDTGLKTGTHKIHFFKPGLDVVKLGNLLNRTMFEDRIPSFIKTDSAGYVSHIVQVELEQGKLTTLNVMLENSEMITGRVTEESGNSVPNVAVFAFDSNGTMASAAITNSDGRYLINNDLAAGSYTIIIPSAFSSGYAPATANVTVPAKDNINFLLEKSGIISGNVVDANGNPVAGAKISVMPKDQILNGSSVAQFLSSNISITDQDGKFLLDSGIASGAFTVTASFGGVPVTSTTSVQVGSQASIALDFKEVITLKGKVIDSTGKPIANASVAPSFASTIPGAELFAARTDPDGMYELVIPLKDSNARSFFGEVVVSAKGYVDTIAKSNITVRLEEMPVVKITGVVIAQKTTSPPVETVLTRNGTVSFEHEGTRYAVGLQVNARVLAATFDPSSKSISIELEGVQDAAGRSEFLVPKDFMAGPFVITLDGKVAESVIMTENQTHAIISINHDDLREVTIQGTTVVPEFPLPAVIVATGMAATIVFLRLKH